MIYPSIKIQFRALAFLTIVSVATSARAAEPLFPGFVVETFATGLNAPVALAFAPDGRLFVGERGGAIRVVDRGFVYPEPFATIPVHDFFESGLLGLAVSPNFVANGYIYAFATITSQEQQILRFVDDGGVGAGRTTVRGNLPTGGAFHNGGCIRFGPDGMLYFSVGDNTSADNSQSLNTLAGKISRIHPDGETPEDNPYVTPTGTPRAVYAMGFRNPFRFCFTPDGRMFAMDIGSDGSVRREELNLVERAGNYGWPLVEGFGGGAASSDGMTDPIMTYHDEGAAPCGIVYYNGANFPSEYQGNLFHVEYTLERIYRVVLNGNAVASHELFVDAEGGPVDLVQGPDGALYYNEIIGGRIMRIRFGDDTSSLLPIDPSGGSVIEPVDREVTEPGGGGNENGNSNSNGNGNGNEMMPPTPTGCAAGLPILFAVSMFTVAASKRRAKSIR